MIKKIQKVAVLGSGVMGSQISGHLSNAGIKNFLFDTDQGLSEKGINSLLTMKPPPLYDIKNIDLITPCNYKEDLKKLNEVDWVIEAVIERLDIKLKVYDQITPFLNKNTLLTSNTSGIPIFELTKNLSLDLQKRFMITHFFNPPRYMHLLELIKSEITSDKTYSIMMHFGETILGKGIVHGKDTPNFIGNRVGIYGMMKAIELTIKNNLLVEEVDALTGPLSGRPKSATFRTADVVGLDTLKNVSLTTYEKAIEDEERDIFNPPTIIDNLIENGRLGQKTREGFYKKDKNGVINSLDLSTSKYSQIREVQFDCITKTKSYQNTSDRLISLCSGSDKGSTFFWESFSSTLIYSANRVPEISNDIINIDNAMKWGFGWEYGPFESWDIIGLRETTNKMIDEGKIVPDWVLYMLSKGRETFYEKKNGKLYYWCPLDNTLKTKNKDPLSINLSLHKTKIESIKKNESASLNNLGDGILNVEFHSVKKPKMQPIDSAILKMINYGLDLIENDKFKGMVLGHQGTNFCVGADLNLILELSEDKEWEKLNFVIKSLQDTTQRIRFSKGPIIATPFELTLGGGVEIIQPSSHIMAASETYMGLVEVAVGLIPGGGGNLRMILNALSSDTKGTTFQKIQTIFETIGFAKTSANAHEAKKIGLMRHSDSIIMNKDHLIKKAKIKALELSTDYKAPVFVDDLLLPGKGGKTALDISLKNFKIQGKISEYDQKIGEKLSHVLTGGENASLIKKVNEQYILDLEREAFVSLTGEQSTQDRIKYMLQKGKPLRN